MAQKQQIEIIKGLDLHESHTYQNLLQIALRRVSFIVLGVVIAVLLGVAFMFVATPKYKSQAQLVVIKKRPDALQPQGSDQHLSGEDYLGTQAGILKSPLIVGRTLEVVKKKKPEALWDYERLARRHGTDLLREVVDGIKVDRDVKDTHNNIIDVSLKTAEEDECRMVLEELLVQYKRFLNETYQNLSEETVHLVVQTRNLLEKDVTRKEGEYRDFRRRIPVVLIHSKENNSTVNHEHILALKQKQIEYQVRRDEIRRRLTVIENAVRGKYSREELVAMVSQLASKSVPDASGKTSDSSLQDKLLPVLLEEKVLREDYGPDNPRVQAAEKRVDLAQRYMTETLKQELLDVERSEQSIAQVLDRELQTAKQATRYEIEDEALRTDLARTHELYDIALKRLQEVDILKDLGGFDATVIGAPCAGKKVFPLWILVLPVSILVGLIIGFLMAYVVDLNDRSFRTAEEIRRRLEFQVVAHIPSLVAETESVPPGGRTGTSRMDPTLVAHHKPKSRCSEAYRGVRTALFFAHGQGHRVIQVTSPNPGDGKSTMTANLAVSVAQAGKKVILVDADLRKPRVHKLFGVSKKIGLSSVIEGEVDLPDAVQASEVPGLSLLPCGPKPPNPAELLTVARFEQLLDTLREQFDLVIVDTPPLLAVTDPAIVAPRVDGILLVVRITKNGRPDAERAKEILKTVDANVIGAVVNGQQIKSGYGGYGSDSYGYSSEEYDYEDREKYYEHEDEDDDLDEPAPSAGATTTKNGLSPATAGGVPPIRSDGKR
jgi:capsular exopolysaccharide synthesis family protein